MQNRSKNRRSAHTMNPKIPNSFLSSIQEHNKIRNSLAFYKLKAKHTPLTEEDLSDIKNKQIDLSLIEGRAKEALEV